MHDGAAPEFGTFRTSPRGRAAFTFTSFGDQGTPTARQEVRAAGGRHAAGAGVRQRQSRLAGGRRHDARRRAAAAVVPPVQRRSLLRQSRRRPGADLVGFLGEQHPQRAQPSVDALARQSRERAGQRTDRLSGLSDLFLGAGGDGPDRCDARALVCLHRRFGAGDQHRQRRRRRIRTAAIPMCGAIRPARRKPGWNRNWRPRGTTAISTGSWCACTRSRSRPPTSSTARIWASARNGCRCSTNTTSTSWCAGTSIITSARTRSAARRRTRR